MSFDAILTLVVIAGVLVVLILDRTSPAMAVLAGTVVLLLTGVIDADDAFAGDVRSRMRTTSTPAMTTRVRIASKLTTPDHALRHHGRGDGHPLRTTDDPRGG